MGTLKNIVANLKLFKRVYIFLGIIIAIVTIGTIGFMFIEKWSFLDAFYMTVITTATVGFEETHQLSPLGKLFTIFLIIISFGTFALAISSITKYIMGGDYKINLKQYRTNKLLNTMENHVVICGFGRVGKQVAEDLNSKKTRLIIIDINAEEFEKSHLLENYVFIKGDSTDDEVLASAKLDKATAVISCLPKDADNLYVVLSARELNRSLKIISRATHATSVAKLKLAGADNVIMPDSIGGTHMASLVANPDVVEFLDSSTSHGCDRASNRTRGLCRAGVPTSRGTAGVDTRRPSCRRCLGPRARANRARSFSTNTILRSAPSRRASPPCREILRQP